MKQVLAFLIAMWSISSHAQSFDQLIHQADSLYDAGNHLAAGQAAEQAFNIQEGDAGQYYNAACSWALAGDTIKSLRFLDMSASKGYLNFDWMHKDKDLRSMHKLQGWQKIAAKVQANLDEYKKDFDQPLKTRLEKIQVKDQMLRQLYKDAEEKFGKDSEEMKYFWQLVSEQDSINEKEVIKIIDERGWPGKSLVGGKANMTVWLVIQHAPIETQEKYLPLLQESVKKGESQGNHLAMLEDRIQMRNGKPQVYGSQITTDPQTGQQVVYEIKDPEYVNQRRREVGLGPIQDYVKRWGIEWTVEQKER